MARFVVYIGLPYAALLTGAFAPRDIGLQGSPAPELLLGWTPDQWTRAIGQAGLLGALALGTMALVAWQVHRAGGYASDALDIAPAPIAQSIRDAVFAEAHWSFYRALPMLILADAHWAALAALALVTVEALLAGWLARGTGHNRLFEVSLAASSATFFALTGGNVWVAIPLQITVRIIATGLAHARQDASSGTEVIA